MKPNITAAQLIEKLRLSGQLKTLDKLVVTKPHKLGQRMADKAAAEVLTIIRQFDDHGLPVPNELDPYMDLQGRIQRPTTPVKL